MKLKINYIPLSFINTNEEIIKQIKNSVLFSYLLSNNEETTLSNYLESTQYGYTASAQPTGNHKLVRITDIRNGEVDWDNVPYCDCDKEDKYLLNVNDILVARTGGTTGKSFFVENAPDNAVFASYLIRLRLKDGVNVDFVNAFLNSYVFWSQIVEMKSGSAMPNVNAEKLKTLRLPKCDSNIQTEVSKVSKGISTNPEFLKIFDNIKTIENYHQNNTDINFELIHQLSLVKQLRQSFLREAMQGKLVEQNKTDEPATELLAKIKAEKALRQAHGTLKKQKPLPPITKEEIPFEIPKNWIWCRLGGTGDLLRGKSKHRPRNDVKLFKNGKYAFIQTGDVARSKNNSYIINSINGYYNDFGLAQSTMLKEGTLCVTIAANIAETGFLGFDACAPDSIVYFNGISKYIDKYVFYFIRDAQEELEKYAPATSQKNINLGILNSLIIPLPPLSEQKRIVAKLDELMAYCDRLEESIKESQTQNEMLLQQVLREALEPEAK